MSMRSSKRALSPLETEMAAVELSDLGSQFHLLCSGVEDSIVKTTPFRPLLRRFKCTVDGLRPLIQEIGQFRNELDERGTAEVKELGSLITQGIELVNNCSNMTRWNPFKKYKYTNKLNELMDSLQNKLDILVTQRARDAMRTMDTVSNIMCSLLKPKGKSDLPMLPQSVVGMDVPLSELKAKFIDDDKVSKLVLTGPGGCGKTTLAIMFCNDQKVKDEFRENIFFVTVPNKTSNVFEEIVEQVYHSKGRSVPPIHNKDVAVDLLQRFMIEEGKIPLLLVLDDVWPAAECVLETFDDVDMKNIKILMTSRSKFRTYASPYYLKPLDDESAMALFRRSASLGDQSSHDVNCLSTKIVEQCKGLPLAITCVGRSLRGRPVESWRARMIQLSRGTIFDSETELFLSLKTSFDVLDTGLKECFMDLGSFPEDHNISVAALLDMYIELYAESQEDEDLYIGNISELINRSLANLTAPEVDMEEDVYYSDKFVTQHALLRELAVYLSRQQDLGQRERLVVHISGDTFPKWWREPKISALNARLASISTEKTFSMKWPEKFVQLPEAEVLILNFEGNYSLPEFVVTMHKLKVLIVTNLAPSPVELSNFQLLESLENMKRIRLEKISMASITKDPIELRSVQKISLCMCDMGQAFPNCPNLEELNIDCCNDLVELPAEICELTYLKILCVTNCHKLSVLSEEIGNLVHLEVLRLRSCTGLKKLPSSLKSLENLSLLDISGCSGIEELQDGFDEMSSLTKINMRQCSSLKELPPSIGLGKLEEVICDEAMKTLWEKFLPNPKIRVLQSEVS